MKDCAACSEFIKTRNCLPFPKFGSELSAFIVLPSQYLIASNWQFFQRPVWLYSIFITLVFLYFFHFRSLIFAPVSVSH